MTKSVNSLAVCRIHAPVTCGAGSLSLSQTATGETGRGSPDFLKSRVHGRLTLVHQPSSHQSSSRTVPESDFCDQPACQIPSYQLTEPAAGARTTPGTSERMRLREAVAWPIEVGEVGST